MLGHKVPSTATFVRTYVLDKGPYKLFSRHKTKEMIFRNSQVLVDNVPVANINHLLKTKHSTTLQNAEKREFYPHINNIS